MSASRGGARPGAGRPPELRDRVQLSITLDGPTLAILDDICQTLQLTRSAALRHILAIVPPPKQPRRKYEKVSRR